MNRGFCFLILKPPCEIGAIVILILKMKSLKATEKLSTLPQSHQTANKLKGFLIRSSPSWSSCPLLGWVLALKDCTRY